MSETDGTQDPSRILQPLIMASLGVTHQLWSFLWWTLFPPSVERGSALHSGLEIPLHSKHHSTKASNLWPLTKITQHILN